MRPISFAVLTLMISYKLGQHTERSEKIFRPAFLLRAGTTIDCLIQAPLIFPALQGNAGHQRRGGRVGDRGCDRTASRVALELRRQRQGQCVKTVALNKGPDGPIHCSRLFATWGNSGIEPDKGKGISSPETYEASLMWPRNDGERQWNTMSGWTCR
jgi:hypothetical protein